MRWLFLALVACGTEESQLRAPLQAKYDANCGTCHEAGAADAPRRGDAVDFGHRLERRGRDGLLATVKSGNRGMPPRGLCYDCTDEELGELVDYLLRSH